MEDIDDEEPSYSPNRDLADQKAEWLGQAYTAKLRRDKRRQRFSQLIALIAQASSSDDPTIRAMHARLLNTDETVKDLGGKSLYEELEREAHRHD